jgi:hypothetical protein
MSREENGIQFQDGADAIAFPLWPYLDGLFRWVESQPSFRTELKQAWRQFAPDAGVLPDWVQVHREPDIFERLCRFMAWFCLDRPLGAGGETPIQRFLVAHLADLTVEGRTIYEDMTRTVYGVFKVHIQFRLPILEHVDSGRRYPLEPIEIATELQVGDWVAGRIYPFGEKCLLDLDAHVGHISESLAGSPLDACDVEHRYFGKLVSAQGPLPDVLDALLIQIGSPLTAEDVYEILRQHTQFESFMDALYDSPAYRLRYLHLRDRRLLAELMQELWDTAGPLEDAALEPEDALSLARAVREGLRAIAEENPTTLLAYADHGAFIPLYLDLFGIKAMKRLVDVAHGGPDTPIRTQHKALPHDGGVFTTLSWGQANDRRSAGFVAKKMADGQWRLQDISVPENSAPAVIMAFERAQTLGWGPNPPEDEVETLLRKTVMEFAYGVHDALDLFRIWRDFKRTAQPDLSQPAIWAAGVELIDLRYRNESVDVLMLARSYGVMPAAIEGAAQQIDETMQTLHMPGGSRQ